MSDLTLEHIAQRITQARVELVEEARAPSCHTCGQALPPRAWRSARDLKLKVFAAAHWGAGDSACIALALSGLVDEGIFEQDHATLKVRLAIPEEGSERP